MTVSATFYHGFKGRQTGTADLGTPNIDIDTGIKTLAFVDGVTDGKADRLFADHRTLAGAASENIDLAGVLLDTFGATLTFSKIKGLYIKAADTNGGDLVVGGAASNGFVGPFGAATHTLAVRPGGVLLLVAPKTGWTVTPTTADLLKILNGNGAAAAEYDIVLLGTSA